MAWTKIFSKSWFTPTLVLAIGSALLTGIGWIINVVVDNKEIMIENEHKMFESVEQRIKTKAHIDEPYNPVNSYIQGNELLEQQAQINEIFKENKKNDSIKKVIEIRIGKSRASRDSSQKVQAQTMKRMDSVNIIQTQTLQLILKKLDSIK